MLLRPFREAHELDVQVRALLVCLTQALLTRKRRVEQALDRPA